MTPVDLLATLPPIPADATPAERAEGEALLAELRALADDADDGPEGALGLSFDGGTW